MTKILIYSGLTWHSISESHCHNLARALSDKYYVRYLEMPYCSDKNRTHIHYNVAVDIPDDISLISDYDHIGSYSVRVERPFNFKYLVRAQIHSIKSFFKVRKQFDVAILYNIYDLPFLLLCKLFSKKVIYAIVDDYPSLTPNKFMKALLSFNEKIFLCLRDASFATAKALTRKDSQAIYVPNTVRITTSSKTSETLLYTNTSETHSVGKPYKACHLGSLGQWVDVESINMAASMLTQVEFHIIGTGEREKDLTDLPNIIKHGQVSKEKVHQLLNEMNVGLICFKINDITNSVSPIKLYEYWQHQLPVIASDTEELKQYQSILRTYYGPHSLANEITSIANNGIEAYSMGKLGWYHLQHNNWGTIAYKYEEIIKKVTQE